IWKTDLPSLLERTKPVVAGWPSDRIEIAPSCSLLHVPIDVELETALDADVKSWLAFSVQKMGELTVLARALTEGQDAVAEQLKASAAATAARASSLKVHDPLVDGRIADVKEAMKKRHSAFADRRRLQD